MNFKEIIFKSRGLLLFITLYFISGSLSILLSTLFFKNKDNNAPIFQFTVLSFMFLISFILIFLINISKRIKITFFSREKLFFSLKYGIISGIIIFALAMLTVIITEQILNLISVPDFILHWFGQNNSGFTMLFHFIEKNNLPIFILLVLYITVLTPIYEEILFRGLLDDFIITYFGVGKAGMFVNAVIFAFFHSFSLANMIFAFIIGYGIIYYKRKNGNLNMPFVIHSTVNIVGLLLGTVANYLK